MDAAFVAETLGRLLAGVPLTLALTGMAISLGVVLAFTLAVLRQCSKLGGWLVPGYVFVLRGSPLLAQIFLIYYGLGQFYAIRSSVLWPILREPFWCAIIALTLNTAAYGSEIVRGGLLSVPRGVVEAGQSLGLSGVLLYRLVILPIAVRQMLPAYGNEVIVMVKATSLASIITLMEITGIARGSAPRRIGRSRYSGAPVCCISLLISSLRVLLAFLNAGSIRIFVRASPISQTL